MKNVVVADLLITAGLLLLVLGGAELLFRRERLEVEPVVIQIVAGMIFLGAAFLLRYFRV